MEGEIKSYFKKSNTQPQDGFREPCNNCQFNYKDDNEFPCIHCKYNDDAVPNYKLIGENYKELFEILSKFIESKKHELYKLKGHNCLAKQWITSLIDLNKKLMKKNDR